jgi:hypothetical protein
MKNRAAVWGALAVILFIVLALLAAKPIRPPKARAHRITGVNTVRSVSMTLTNTNALSGAQRGLGK